SIRGREAGSDNNTLNASCGLPEGTDSLGASVEQRGVPGAVQGQDNRRSTMPVPDRSTFESAYAGQAPTVPDVTPGRQAAGGKVFGDGVGCSVIVWSLSQSRFVSCGSRAVSNSCRASRSSGLTM